MVTATHLALLMVNYWHLELVMATYSDLLMVNYLVLHLDLKIETQLGLMKELIWVIHMDPLIVIIKANFLVCCLVTHLDQVTEIFWFVQLVL